jgi:hypothetical protein
MALSREDLQALSVPNESPMRGGSAEVVLKRDGKSKGGGYQAKSSIFNAARPV